MTSLVEKVKEEARQAELRRQEWEAQQEQCRQEEDRDCGAESIVDADCKPSLCELPSTPAEVEIRR